MGRVGFVTHRDLSILKIDLSHLANIDDSLAELAQAKSVISTQPPGSLRLLTDVTGMVFNPKWVEEIKRFTTFSTPFIKASAVIGVTAFSHVIYDSVIRSAGRTIASFDTEADAIAWLVEQ